MPYYEGMKFPDFEQKDWPKLAYPQGNARGKPTVLCRDQAEYDAAMGKAPGPGATTSDGAETPKEKALREANELGVKVNGTWGSDRINAAIAEFQAQASANGAQAGAANPDDDD